MRPHTPAQNITQVWNSSTHRGTDWGMPIGTSLVAVMDGTVVDYTRANGAEVNRPLRGHMTNRQHWSSSRGGIDDIGNCLVLKHSNTTYTVYLHVSPYNVSALRGRAFKKGDVLPVTSGHNGWSTGPHLHFEVFINGTRRNPVPWLDGIAKPKPVTGEIMDTNAKVQSMYRLLRGRDATAAEVAGWRGKTYQAFAESPLTKTEVTNRTNRLNSLEKQVSDLTRRMTALEKTNSEQASALDKANKQVNDAVAQLNQKQEEIAILQEDVSKLKETNKTLLNELKGAEKEIALLEKENARLVLELGEKGELTGAQHIILGFKKLIERIKRW